jgi:large subunit ribosomal protein L13
VSLAKEVVPLRTFSPRPADITRRWLVIDAENAILGRLSTEVATLLRGKHKPIWAPHVDTGDHVIVINASKLAIDPKKATDKLYHRHTGYPGGIRTESLEHLLARNPERVIRLAVRRMLPKNPLGRSMLKKLKIYGGPTHPHFAQQPVDYELPARSRARTSA